MAATTAGEHSTAVRQSMGPTFERFDGLTTQLLRTKNHGGQCGMHAAIELEITAPPTDPQRATQQQLTSRAARHVNNLAPIPVLRVLSHPHISLLCRAQNFLSIKKEFCEVTQKTTDNQRLH
eukprot:1339096-Amorphochlora_amoeboformis.AAC.2